MKTGRISRTGVIPSRRGTASFGRAPSSRIGAILPKITLFRAEVQSLVSFSEEVSTQRFLITKDHGAYIGCSVGPAPAKKRLFIFLCG